MTDKMRILAGSHRPPFVGGEPLGRVSPDLPITVSVYFKPGAIAEAVPASRYDMVQARAQEHAADIAAISDFAKAAQLTVSAVSPAQRLIRLTGSAAAMEAAFGTELHVLQMSSAVYRTREGPLHVPAGLSDRIAAILGLDTRPAATPKIVPHSGPTPPAGFLPNHVAQLYGFAGVAAPGQCIGIIELGGGYTPADNTAAFGAMALPVPEIVAVGVDGATNAPGDTSGANGEVALDIQVAGGVAPGARIAVYFAPNTDQGFADAISQAVHDAVNRPSVLSISWGSAESGWTGQAIAAMSQAFGDAAQLGVTVCAASGDGLATDGVSDGHAHVDYPASDPLVLGCGGTRITASATAITHEVVWKSNGGGTGGGVSGLFTVPPWQQGVNVPAPAVPAGGRGVPDVAGNADPDSGYRIVVAGKVGIFGGTSAVAPLWAGIIAGLNAARKVPAGQIQPALYGEPAALRDIVSGNNKVGKIGFSAHAGWDACTGLGSPNGANLRKLFATTTRHAVE